MINEHLTDEEIQEYALAEASLSPEDDSNLVLKDDSNLAVHLRSCDSCRLRVIDYKLLFTALEEQQPAIFEFDLAALVMERKDGAAASIKKATAPSRKPTPSGIWSGIGLAAAIIAGLAVPVVFLLRYGTIVTGLFRNLAPLTIPLISTAVVSVMVFLFTDMYKQYRRKLSLMGLQ